jgi:hypothetical protein
LVEDTPIIPGLEEALVIEKRFLLEEEIRLTTRRVDPYALAHDAAP